MWLLRVMLPILALGAIVPYFKGYDFLDALLLMVYALTPLLFSPAGNFRRADVVRASALTAIIPVASIALGLAIVAIKLGALILPPANFLLALGVLSAASAVFGVAAKAWLARHFDDPQQARRIVLLLIGIALFLHMLGVPLLPAAYTSSTSMIGIALVSSILMLGASFALVRR